MKTNKFTLVLSLILIIGTFYISCKKTEVDSDTTSSNDNSTAEDASSGVFRTVNEKSDTTNRYRSGCPAIYIDTAVGGTYSRTLTIDYGTSGCHNRKGSFTAIFTKPFRDQGSIITITFDNYYEGDTKFDAKTYTITNKGMMPPSNNYVYEMNIVDATLITKDGTAKWNSTKSIEWTNGNATPDISDDVFMISGTASGTSAKGVDYTVQINTPLKITAICDWVESGAFTLTPIGKSSRIVDFGNGNCDNKATVTIDSKKYDLNL